MKTFGTSDGGLGGTSFIQSTSRVEYVKRKAPSALVNTFCAAWADADVTKETGKHGKRTQRTNIVHLFAILRVKASSKSTRCHFERFHHIRQGVAPSLQHACHLERLGACIMCLHAYNRCMQYTLRNVPGVLDEALRRAARERGKSLNEVAIEALGRGAGITPERRRHRDLADIAGTWRKDAAFDSALAVQDTIDESVDEADG